ncbi:hypothetical protein VNO77_18286 [Canavalia gladiata]|uniref:Uncharacterized protein n=1 Tax=Canavalia gladiata TaxID=3824 RepID=A0AAN9QK69_CANGL
MHTTSIKCEPYTLHQDFGFIELSKQDTDLRKLLVGLHFPPCWEGFFLGCCSVRNHIEILTYSSTYKVASALQIPLQRMEEDPNSTQEPSAMTRQLQSKQERLPDWSIANYENFRSLVWSRQYQPEGDESGVQTLAHHLKRKREDAQQSKTSSSIIKFWSLFPLSITDIVPCLEDLSQKVVREELERKLSQRPIISNNESAMCGAKLFRLVFKNELPDTTFTFTKIKAKDGTPVEIALYDIKSESIVDEGLLSSMKIEICVLNGDFGSDGTEDWSADEFKAKIMTPRKNKGQLLKGDTVIALNRGRAEILNLEFTDISHCTRSGHYRIGAKAVQPKFYEAINIREAITTPISVKDRRGEQNQKHFPPSPNDEVWRLRNISKGGKIDKLLSSHQIYTVGDLLLLHETDPSYLQKGLVAVETTTHDFGRTFTGIQTVQYGAPEQGQQQPFFLTAQQEEIPGQMMPLNWSVASTNVDDGNGLPIGESEIDGFAWRPAT